MNLLSISSTLVQPTFSNGILYQSIIIFLIRSCSRRLMTQLTAEWLKTLVSLMPKRKRRRGKIVFWLAYLCVRVYSLFKVFSFSFFFQKLFPQKSFPRISSSVSTSLVFTVLQNGCYRFIKFQTLTKVNHKRQRVDAFNWTPDKWLKTRLVFFMLASTTTFYHNVGGT